MNLFADGLLVILRVELGGFAFFLLATDGGAILRRVAERDTEANHEFGLPQVAVARVVAILKTYAHLGPAFFASHIYGGLGGADFFAHLFQSRLVAQRKVGEAVAVNNGIRHGRQLQRRPGGGEITIQKAIHGKDGLRTLVAVSLELLDAFALLVLERQHIHESPPAGAITLLNDFGGHVEPGEVLLRDGERFISERGTKQCFGEITAQGLKLHIFSGDSYSELGGSHLAHRAGFAEERKFLFKAVEQIAVVFTHGAFGSHHSDAGHRVFPGADGFYVGAGGVGAGAGGEQAWMIRRHLLGKLIYQGGGDLERRGFRTRRIGDRCSECQVRRNEQCKTANYFCFHADRDFFLRRTTGTVRNAPARYTLRAFSREESDQQGAIPSEQREGVRRGSRQSGRGDLRTRGFRKSPRDEC